MEFLYSSSWWIFVFLVFIFCFLYRFGHHGRGSLSPILKLFGIFGVLIVIVITFILLGWLAGLGIIILAICSVFVSDILSWLLYRGSKQSVREITFKQFLNRWKIERDRRKATRFLTEPLSFETMAKNFDTEEEKKDHLLSRVAKKTTIKEILYNYGKDINYLRVIYDLFISKGTGPYVAETVISTPKLLDIYLDMESDDEPQEHKVYWFVITLGG